MVYYIQKERLVLACVRINFRVLNITVNFQCFKYNSFFPLGKETFLNLLLIHSMSENTKSITIKGLFWNAIDRFGNQAIVTIVGIITARILTPEDFGVIGVLLIFSTVATAFIDSGLATSLVRTKVVDERDYSSMFVFNLTASIVLYGVLFFLAPLIEQHNNIENLSLYARIMFLQIVVHAFGI